LLTTVLDPQRWQQQRVYRDLKETLRAGAAVV
jgi:hypothetical protein